MAFGKSKTSHRTPLQRLNDQRRSVALAGLAAGAAIAAIFRRKRSGGEAEFGEALPVAPPPEPIATPPRAESGPTAAVEIPAPADEPADIEISTPPAESPSTENAAASEPTDDPASPGDAAPSPAVEPATGELSAEEASILAVLAQSGRVDDDRTALAVATSLEREATEVATVLRKLGAEGVVSGDLQSASGEEIWAVTERGVRRLGAQS